MLNISLFCVYLSDGKNTIPIFCVSSFIRLLIFSFSLVTIWSIGWLFSLFLLWLSDQLVGIFSLSLFWHTPTRSVVVFLLLFTFFFLISHSLLSVSTYSFSCYLSPFIYFLVLLFPLSFSLYFIWLCDWHIICFSLWVCPSPSNFSIFWFCVYLSV